MELKQLDEILSILRDHDVSSFTCAEFSVVLGPALPTADEEVAAKPGELVKVRPGSVTPVSNLYANRSLWPNGEPPTFPKKAV